MKKKEIERIYLIKMLPRDLSKFKKVYIKVGDFFSPSRAEALRIRQIGNRYELLKKEYISSINRTEHIISITKSEFKQLFKAVQYVNEKIRFFYPLDKKFCEIDIYKGKLLGYCRVEIEFENEKEAESFSPPIWFAEEITEINHNIHKNLGKINYSDLNDRFNNIGIKLEKIIYKKNGRNSNY